MTAQTDDLLPDAAVPTLPRGVRLREDPERGWLLLGPERVLTLDAIAVAVLEQVDGTRPFAQIVDALAEKYQAPRDRIETDARAFLVSLIEKRMLEAAP